MLEGQIRADGFGTRIWERLWLGSSDDAERLADANLNRITTVITLSDSPVRSIRPDVNYIHIPIEHGAVSVGRFDAVIDAMSENIRWGRVLLHCDKGANAAPSLTAAYMDSVGYRNLNTALAEIHRVRPFVHPSNALLNSLRRNLA